MTEQDVAASTAGDEAAFHARSQEFVHRLWQLFLNGFACGRASGGDPSWRLEAARAFPAELHGVFPSLVGVAERSSTWFCQRLTPIGWASELHPHGIAGVGEETLARVSVKKVDMMVHYRRCMRVPVYLVGADLTTIERHFADLAGDHV